MPLRASCAASIVPENPPPIIATGTRSDFIIRPILRVRSARLSRVDVVVDPGHGLARGLGEAAGDHRMDHARETRTDQLRANFSCAGAMPCPGHSKRARVLDEQPCEWSGT